jgi:hypothetical protein
MTLVLLTIMSSMALANAPSDWKTYTGKHFTFQYPPTWDIRKIPSSEPDPSELESVVIGKNVSNFMISRKIQKADIVDLATSKKSTDSRAASGSDKRGRLVHSEIIKMQGLDTYRFDRVREGFGEIKYLEETRVVALGTAGHVLMMAACPDDDEATREIYKTLLASIQFKISEKTGD